MNCADKLAGTDLSSRNDHVAIIGEGDIILTGPSASVTHVLLATSRMLQVESGRKELKTSPDHELYACDTIETTPLLGDCMFKGRLHRCRYYFQRNPCNGVVTLVGTSPSDSENVPVAIDPQPTKFVFHPFRKGHGGHKLLDPVKFKEAVRITDETSWSYGLTTVVKVFLDVPHQRSSLDEHKYQDAASQKKLMMKLRRRWNRRPICPSVAIIVWQRYFELLHADKSDDADTAAAKDILRWVPLKSDQTYPSNVVKVLTSRKWLMRNDIYDLKPGNAPTSASTTDEEALSALSEDDSVGSADRSEPDEALISEQSHISLSNPMTSFRSQPGPPHLVHTMPGY